MEHINNQEVVLRVVNLKQHFATGSGKYKMYNKAVDGVSFELKRGEVFSLVGESGSGKTTTGRTIIRLYNATDGEVFLLDKRIVAGTLGLTNQIKEARAKIANKKKLLKNNEISKEDFDLFASEQREYIREAKVEIAQRKKDQVDRYLPTKEQIHDDKAIAEENIEQLKQQLAQVESDFAKFKKGAFLEIDGLPKETPAKERETLHAKALEKYRAKRSETRLKVEEIKQEITRNHMSYKSAGRSLMKKLQMIFQDPIDSLNPRLTVKEIIAEGLYINGIRDKKIVTEKVYEALRLVGLMPEHASHYPHEFSGGQRQRVGLARAIVCEPEIIIADEPISALDVSIQAQVINLLQDLNQQLGLTILFVAHDLSVVKHFSDKIAVMYLGKIVEMGEKDKIFANPLHPYTQSLFSSIPQPSPEYEKLREGISRYNPEVHEYNENSVIEVREVEPGHLVLCSEEEYEKYLRIVNGKKK